MAKYRLRLNVTRTFEADIEVEAASPDSALTALEGLNMDELHLTSCDAGQVDVVAIAPVEKKVA